MRKLHERVTRFIVVNGDVVLIQQLLRKIEFDHRPRFRSQLNVLL